MVVKSEIGQKREFNHVIINDNLDVAFKNLENIILKEINGIKK